MNREEARTRVVELLLGDQNPNADFYKKLFQQYNYGDSELTPISPAKMGNVNEANNIVITEEAYNELIKIRNITLQTNQEVGYLVFGEEKPDGTVWLDTVISTHQASERISASFDDTAPILTDYVRKMESGNFNDSNKQIICHGHTHGTSPVSDNFSFGDLISYVEFNNSHPLFKNRQIETMAMLMTPCGDFNFIMYENNPQYEGFYIFPTVHLRHQSGLYEELPAYQNGNYLVNNNGYHTR